MTRLRAGFDDLTDEELAAILGEDDARDAASATHTSSIHLPRRLRPRQLQRAFEKLLTRFGNTALPAMSYVVG